jgi:hypothetical protein
LESDAEELACDELDCAIAAAAAKEIIKKRRKILCILDLTALERILKTSATWMQSRWGKGAFILPRAMRRWKKTALSLRKLAKPEGQGLVGNC